jgi:hypothetical protein
MKKTLIILILLITSTGSFTFSQDTSIVKFLPLKVGNVWVYRYNAFNMSPPCYANVLIRVKLTGTSVYNSKTYFLSQISTIVSGGYGGCNMGFLPFDSLLRIDSSSGKLLRYAPGAGCFTPNETMLDSFKARFHDTIRVYCQAPLQYAGPYTCYDTNNVTVFGSSRQSRRFNFLQFEGGWARTYAKGIGLVRSDCYSQACPGNSQLLGCVIDGVVYGDTAFVVGVNIISTEVPESFSLYQNYPNPFNPSTKIKFDIPVGNGRDRSVMLKIYDALGREIAVLVNEQLRSGTYEAEWNASDYASGIYYYKLTAGEFSETKKMVLIK